MKYVISTKTENISRGGTRGVYTVQHFKISTKPISCIAYPRMPATCVFVVRFWFEQPLASLAFEHTVAWPGRVGYSATRKRIIGAGAVTTGVLRFTFLCLDILRQKYTPVCQTFQRRIPSYGGHSTLLNSSCMIEFQSIQLNIPLYMLLRNKWLMPPHFSICCSEFSNYLLLQFLFQTMCSTLVREQVEEDRAVSACFTYYVTIVTLFHVTFDVTAAHALLASLCLIWT